MPRRILIAEGDATTAARYSAFLEAEGYLTTTALSSEDAMLSVDRDRPDLVLIDVRLQGVPSGVGTALQIRNKSRIPVIFLSEFSDEDTVALAMRAGAVDFMHRPVSLPELAQRIEAAFARAKPRARRAT